MDLLKKKRSSARGWVTRSGNVLKEIIDSSNPTKRELLLAIADFEKRMDTLDTVQSGYELELEPESLDEDLNEADQFRRKANIVRIQAEELLERITVVPTEDLNVSSSYTSVENKNVRLPKLELPKFSGAVTEWTTFWDQFRMHIDRSNISIISKFSYLVSYLEGEAKHVIQGISLTEANYPVACELLKNRYGRPERIVFSHVQSLLNCKVPSLSNSNNGNYVAQLWKLRDELISNIRGLETYEVSGKQCEVFLTPIILSRFPEELRFEWARDGAGHESDLKFLLEFLQIHIERLERAETFKGLDNKSVKPDVKKKSATNKEGLSSASALHSSNSVKELCSFCKKKHNSEDCYSILKLTHVDRLEMIKKNHLCFKCLNPGHVSTSCKSKCSKCNGNHNVLMCGFKLEKVHENQATEVSNTNVKPIPSQGSAGVLSNNYSITSNLITTSGPPGLSNKGSLEENCIILQTATVNVLSQGQYHKAKVMFDSGAGRTYISKKFVNKCKPKWVDRAFLPYSCFGGTSSSNNEPRNIFEVNLLDCNNTSIPLIAAEMPKIAQPLIRPKVPIKLLDSFKHIKLADNYINTETIDVDILVGLDNYWKLIFPNDAVQIENMVAMKSVFGWILSGQFSSNISLCSNPVFLCFSCVTEDDLNKFWDLESVGISSSEPDKSDSSFLLADFANTISYNDNRYEVALPWKNELLKSKLVNNERLALKRLEKLNVRLNKDSMLKENYDKIFEQYESSGIIEQVPDREIICSDPIFYLPHHPVVKATSATTKVRPVFDASAKSYNGISLNDCMSTGPSLNPDLVAVLIRFRRWPIAITADITKAFLQIEVKPQDRNVHRFLLNGKNNTVKHMRFTRVPFGNTSSPFLLNATIKTHLDKYAPTEVIEELKQDMYVDNWLGGANSTDEASKKFNVAHEVFAKAGMPLTQFVSNCLLINSPYIDNSYSNFTHEDHSNSVLGMKWLSQSDIFVFDGVKIDSSYDIIFTKRFTLSIVAKFFDPLGLISPYIMYGKILVQDIWKLGLQWDDPLPLELKEKLEQWIESSKSFNDLQIRRCYFKGTCWTNIDNIELHVFCDASSKGYGACAYIRIPTSENRYQVSLVISKSRVAPIKLLTLPKLELMGAVLCARLANFVKNSLNFGKKCKMYCHTDSTIVLSWIKGNPHNWKVFVSNRVQEIQTLVAPCNWYHCNGKDNPADLISRGILGNKIVNSDFWFYGPSWLSEISCDVSDNIISDTGKDVEVICDNVQDLICLTYNNVQNLIDIEKFSKFSTLQRIVAWTIRFGNNCRKNKVKISGPLVNDELDYANMKLIQYVQMLSYSNEINMLMNNKVISRESKIYKLDPFLDETNVLRIKGRLEFADLNYNCKHPVIIPYGHFAKLLVAFTHTFLKHAGINLLISTLRSNYWIISIRRLVKKVIKECIYCKRYDSRPCSQPVAPLPASRIKSTPPFCITGLDFAGPVYCSDFPGNKFYILLLTCAVIRGIHLELTDSLGLKDCLLAIRRFIARRGIPTLLYSDNAKTFIAASSELPKIYGPFSPKWKFNAPKAAWWGGYWERLVRTVKSALKKTLNVKYLPRIELETILIEIESCVNSRPLVCMIDEENPFGYLSPAHFILGRDPCSKFDINSGVSYNLSSDEFIQRHSIQKKLLDKFWSIWSNDYITKLPHIVKGFKQNCKLKKGNLVLLRDSSLRLKWPLGVITETHPSADGLIRSVSVKTAKGTFKRPIQLLHDLEIYNESLETSNSSNDVSVNLDSNNLLNSTKVNSINSTTSDITEENKDVPKKVSRYGRTIKSTKKFEA